MAVSSRGSAKGTDKISIEYPNIIRIVLIKEFASFKHQIKNFWVVILFFIPLTPMFFLTGQQLSDFQNFTNNFALLWIIIVVFIYFLYSLRSNVVGTVIFDLKSQTVSKARLRVVPLFQKEYIDKTFPFSSVKSIETNKDESELNNSQTFHNLNLEMTFYDSGLKLLLLHLPPSGILQSLAYADLIKFFESAVNSKPDMITDDLTKEFKLENAKIPYLAKHYTNN